MLDHPVFIGLIPGTRRRPGHYAVLDWRGEIILQGTTPTSQLAEIVGRYPQAVCALGAPLGPGKGLMSQPDVRQRLGLPPKRSTWSRFRVCEYQLRRRGIRVRGTPSDPAQATNPLKLAWKVVAGLRQTGCVDFRPETHAPPPHRLLEVHPPASFAALLGRLPFRRNTLEGRLQRQLVLEDRRVPVPDAMNVFEEMTRSHILRGELDLTKLHTPHELDALAAALTAAYAIQRPNQITLVGEPEEGQIIVPAGFLKETYRVV